MGLGKAQLKKLQNDFLRLNYLVVPQILVNSLKSNDLNENTGFKSTVF